MQLPPNRRSSVRTRRTRGRPPAFPDSTSLADSSIAQSEVILPPAAAPRHLYSNRNIVLALLAVGLLGEVFYLALCPLLASNTATDPLYRTWSTLFPWLPAFHWWTLLPTSFFASVSWLDPTSARGRANLLLCLCTLAFCVSVLAALLGRHWSRSRNIPFSSRTIFWTIFVLTLIFGLTMLCAPLNLSMLAQQMLASGLYGRLVVIYHVNPYVVAPAAFPLDQLQIFNAILLGGAVHVPVASAGPVWTDLCILMTLAANNGIAGALLNFRLLGLVAHLSSVALIWTILGRLRPQARISATVLYAWNPLILILGISQVHIEIILVLFILLAVYFFQRNSLLLSWVFVLLAALVSLQCLLLLPLFLRIVARRTRFMGWFWRVCWWFGWLLVTALVVVLAYAPFWLDWGWSGLARSLLQVFWQNNAINSFDAALLHLPLRFPASVLWLFAPLHWTVFMLVVIGGYLLFSFWLVDTIELALLCGSGLLLLLTLLEPAYWPWYPILSFVLALCSGSRNALLLALLLVAGALVSYYFWQWSPAWPEQGLITIGVPGLAWGWLLFLASTWGRMRTGDDASVEDEDSRPLPLQRPPWFSRPWSSRPNRRTI